VAVTSCWMLPMMLASRMTTVNLVAACTEAACSMVYGPDTLRAAHA
jgi:hypothetical protein